MAININNLVSSTNVGKNDRLQKSTEADDTSKKAELSSKDTLADDTVALSDTAQLLKNQEAKIRQLPDIDMDKVEQIKQAIAAGEYKIDTQKLANNMLSVDALFS